MVAPLGPIVPSLTLAAGGCGWDTRRGKSPAPAADSEPIVLDKLDIYAVVDALQQDGANVGQCSLDEIKFTAADGGDLTVKSAELTRLAIAQRILIKFDDYNKLPDLTKLGVIKLMSDELKKEGPASLESLMTWRQGMSYGAYCKTHYTWYAPATYGQLPEALALKNLKVSDVKALLEKCKLTITPTPLSVSVGERRTVTLNSKLLPRDASALKIDFGKGIDTPDLPEAAAEPGKVTVKIVINEKAEPGFRDIVVEQSGRELISGKGLFDVIAEKHPAPLLEKTGEKPAPSAVEKPAEEPEEAPRVRHVRKTKSTPPPATKRESDSEL
ncbi:MAG: hypothetical protein JW873_06455 [Candidatus Saganbacteria bacterium]|nr:hypothetical protein [Candidatus Saganbacteria bacterium]